MSCPLSCESDGLCESSCDNTLFCESDPDCDFSDLAAAIGSSIGSIVCCCFVIGFLLSLCYNHQRNNSPPPAYIAPSPNYNQSSAPVAVYSTPNQYNSSANQSYNNTYTPVISTQLHRGLNVPTYTNPVTVNASVMDEKDVDKLPTAHVIV